MEENLVVIYLKIYHFFLHMQDFPIVIPSNNSSIFRISLFKFIFFSEIFKHYLEMCYNNYLGVASDKIREGKKWAVYSIHIVNFFLILHSVSPFLSLLALPLRFTMVIPS